MDNGGIAAMWRSYDDFHQWNFPVAIGNPRGLYRLYARQTALERTANLVERLNALEKTTRELDAVWSPHETPHSSGLTGSRQLVIELACDGEEVLLYCEPVGRSEIAAGFRSEKNLFEHWDRYTVKRLGIELPKLIAAARDLSVSVRAHIGEHGHVLNSLTGDLPPHLQSHFLVARDLWSVEMGEMAGFAALRGLEAVLREITRKSGNTLRRNGRKVEPVADLDLFDLIEASHRLRWVSDKRPVLDRRTRAILHYLRQVRNATAHPESDDNVDTWDETVMSATKQAAGLWKISKHGRRKAMPRELSRDW